MEPLNASMSDEDIEALAIAERLALLKEINDA